MIWGQKALEDLIARLERRIDQLDERIVTQLAAADDRGRRTEEQLADLRQRHDDQSRRIDEQLGELRERHDGQSSRTEEQLAALRQQHSEQGRLTEERLAALAEKQTAGAAGIIDLQRQAAGTAAEVGRLHATTRELAPAVSAELSKLVGIAEQNFALTSRLDADVVAGFAGYSHRLENDLVALTAQNRQLGESVSQISGWIERLERAMTAGLAAVGDRWGADLAQVAEQSRQLGGTITQLGEFVQRLDRDVGQGFAAVSQRLETDLVQLADQSRQLGATISQLGEFLQRLDRDVGEGFGAVGSRLESDLVSLVGRTGHLDSSVTQLTEFVQRLDRDVGEGLSAVGARLETDLVSLVDRSGQLDGSIGRLTEFLQRLDGNVGEQFAAVGKRLDTDLILVAEQSRQLGGTISQLGEFLQRLDRDVGEGLGAIGGRLETDLVSLVDRSGQLDASVSQLSQFVQRLDRDVGEQFAANGQRLDADLHIVAEQTRQLGGNVSQLSEFLQRLDRDVGEGFGAVGARLETDLISLVDRSGLLDASIARLTEFLQRLDGNVGEQFGAVGKRLDTDLIIVAEQSRQLGMTVSQLGEFLQRVDVDLGAGLGAIGSRLEGDLVSLVERSQHLDVTVAQLTGVVQRLDSNVGEQFGAVGNRLDTDLVTLAEQNRQLGGTVSDLSGAVSKLDSNVAKQFTAVGKRVEKDLTIMADQSHQLGGMISELSKFMQRLDSDVAKQLEAVSARLDTDLVSVSEQSRQLAGTVSRLSEFMQRLDKNTAEQFSAVGQRLETDLVSLAQQSRQLGENVSQLSGFLQRMDSNVAEQSAAVGKRLETDLSLLAENSRRLDAGLSRLAAAIPERLEVGGADVLSGFVTRLSTDLSSFSSLLSRLDHDVATGFSAVGTRLETDLVTLARTTHELVESSRYASGTLSKLAADQIQFANGGRTNGASGPHALIAATAGAAPVDAPILPFAEAEMPAAVRKWLAKYDTAPSRPGWYLNEKLLPHTPDGLPQLIDMMAACRQRLQPGERLVWARQVEREPLLAPNEIEQVLGLLGPVQGPHEVADKGKKWQVAVATRRVEAASIVLRWSVPALEPLHVRFRPLADEMLGRLGLREAAHAVDLPEPGSDLDSWARLLPSLVATVCTRDGVPIGITLPIRFDEIPDAMDNALARLRQALRDGGKPDEIAFQWVRGSVSIGRSPAVIDFARRHSIGFDLTPVNRDALDSRLAAYDDRFPYRALAFDLRLPSHAAQKDGVIEVPRWPGRSLDSRMAHGEAAGLSATFDAEFEHGRKRLARVLDRLGQKQFELQVNLDATQIEYWPHYFVHNWSPPAPAWLRMFEFDAGDMFSRATPLLRVAGGGHLDRGDPRSLSGSQFFAAAAKAAAMRVESGESLRQAQIEAHSYLRDRVEITADAERLITWMPEKLGTTLELGSGLGVMARRIRDRATSYLGVDLTVEQVTGLRELGAGGLVADMQALPFGDSLFDTVVADNVVEHAADPVQALLECARVLKPGGQAFMVIPPDYLRPEFSNEAHLWKADEASVREALTRAGLRIVREETLYMADLGISGAHPSSDGKTTLWQVEKGLAASSADHETRIQLQFPECLQDFPEQYQAALNATNAILDIVPKSDFSALARHSPGLANFDWSSYLRLSAIRMVRVGAALRATGLRKGKVLDFGSYFGNFSLFVRELGFEVDAADQYGSYGKAFKHALPLMQSAGIQVIDLSAGGKSDLGRFPENSYDAVLLLGVIEHIPHTPKPLLLALNRVLRPGGTLVMDTPNLSYIYTREKLVSGRPIAAPIQIQFDVEPPFEGHHREYTPDEMVWMLEQIGHEDIHVEMFNYSAYGLSELSGQDAERFRQMESDPQLRELILTRSRKPSGIQRSRSAAHAASAGRK